MDIVDIFMTRALSGMVVPCLYYTNTWYSKYLPYVFFFFFSLFFASRLISEVECQHVYHTTTLVQHIMYHVSLIQMLLSIVLLTRNTVLSSFRKQSFTLLKHVPITCFSTTFALSYGLSFATVTSTLIHAFLYFRKPIWARCCRSAEREDIHSRLMSKYKKVPEWWYMIIFGGSYLGALFLALIFSPCT